MIVNDSCGNDGGILYGDAFSDTYDGDGIHGRHHTGSCNGDVGDDGDNIHGNPNDSSRLEKISSIWKLIQSVSCL
jgi:hypothetical protein